MSTELLERRLAAIEETQREILRRIGRVKSKDGLFLGSHAAARHVRMRSQDLLAILEIGGIPGAVKERRGAHGHSWKIPRDSLDAWARARQGNAAVAQ